MVIVALVLFIFGDLPTSRIEVLADTFTAPCRVDRLGQCFWTILNDWPFARIHVSFGV